MAEPDDLLVRPAREEDLPAAMELFEELDRHQHGWRVFEPRPTRAGEAEARYRSGLTTDADAMLVVAERGGQVVGMAFARVDVLSSISDDRVAELSNVVVRREARSQGIGRALVAQVGRWAASRGAGRLAIRTYSENLEALAFWEHLGFQPRYVQMTAQSGDLAACAPDP